MSHFIRLYAAVGALGHQPSPDPIASEVRNDTSVNRRLGNLVRVEEPSRDAPRPNSSQDRNILSGSASNTSWVEDQKRRTRRERRKHRQIQHANKSWSSSQRGHIPKQANIDSSETGRLNILVGWLAAWIGVFYDWFVSFYIWYQGQEHFAFSWERAIWAFFLNALIDSNAQGFEIWKTSSENEEFCSGQSKFMKEFLTLAKSFSQDPPNDDYQKIHKLLKDPPLEYYNPARTLAQSMSAFAVDSAYQNWFLHRLDRWDPETQGLYLFGDTPETAWKISSSLWLPENWLLRGLLKGLYSSACERVYMVPIYLITGVPQMICGQCFFGARTYGKAAELYQPKEAAAATLALQGSQIEWQRLQLLPDIYFRWGNPGSGDDWSQVLCNPSMIIVAN